ncbi:hypothetical protein PsYK624_158130 [Phanerochaete sordida]|uniref:Uncharacterized protein n=1 Tax=Phanerochaete sordida TaxID=48140 RepID=A0A9P3GQZ4_9APHY|nr:hypothetical protein PsYK624_158130 [Phanerochaete sordida]
MVLVLAGQAEIKLYLDVVERRRLDEFEHCIRGSRLYNLGTVPARTVLYKPTFADDRPRGITWADGATVLITAAFLVHPYSYLIAGRTSGCVQRQRPPLSLGSGTSVEAHYDESTAHQPPVCARCPEASGSFAFVLEVLPVERRSSAAWIVSDQRS